MATSGSASQIARIPRGTWSRKGAVYCWDSGGFLERRMTRKIGKVLCMTMHGSNMISQVNPAQSPKRPAQSKVPTIFASCGTSCWPGVKFQECAWPGKCHEQSLKGLAGMVNFWEQKGKNIARHFRCDHGTYGYGCLCVQLPTDRV